MYCRRLFNSLVNRHWPRCLITDWANCHRRPPQRNEAECCQTCHGHLAGHPHSAAVGGLDTRRKEWREFKNRTIITQIDAEPLLHQADQITTNRIAIIFVNRSWLMWTAEPLCNDFALFYRNFQKQSFPIGRNVIACLSIQFRKANYIYSTFLNRLTGTRSHVTADQLNQKLTNRGAIYGPYFTNENLRPAFLKRLPCSP